MTKETAVDQRLFRDVMGTFATGVTVTTINVDDQPYGMTMNAVVSLSLDPPLVVVCVQQSSSMHERFLKADAFCVNILSSDQKPISDLFAAHGDPEEPMGGFDYSNGKIGTPVLAGALAYAECRVSERLPGGDHTIVIGEAIDVDFGSEDDLPLLFYRGKYRRLADGA